MQEMTPEARRAFLLAGTRTGKLATTRPDGRPHVVPIWFLLDGDDILFMMGETSLKARNIAQNSRVALLVDEETFPYAFVLVEGTVSTSNDDMQAMLRWATEIARRYVGDERAEEYGRRNAVPEELLVRLTPTRIVARTGIAD